MLTREQVLEIAALARLEVDDQEIENLQRDLSHVIAHMDSLEAVDTDSIAPMITTLPEPGDLRPDETETTFTAETATKHAPDSKGTYFKVPAIIPPSSQKA